MTQEEKTRIEGRIVDVLKTVYDPEIPVNILWRPMISTMVTRPRQMEAPPPHKQPTHALSPSCPAADFILEDVRQKVDSLEGVKSANVNLVFEPAWDQSMLSEEARLELGID